MNAPERVQVKRELAMRGYAGTIVTDAPEPTTLYRHIPGYNMDGRMAFEVGSVAQRGVFDPWHLEKKARIGWLAWKPGAECLSRPNGGCGPCVEAAAGRDLNPGPPPQAGASTPQAAPQIEQAVCDQCGWVSNSRTTAGRGGALRFHMKKHAA